MYKVTKNHIFAFLTTKVKTSQAVIKTKEQTPQDETSDKILKKGESSIVDIL